MVSLFNEILSRPLFNALIFLYNIAGHDFGVAIILLTAVIRLILYPLNQKAIKSQKEMQVIQPKVKEIQQKYKGDTQKQGQALMELYKVHKINPTSGCLPLLIQFPVLIALFGVLRTGLDPKSLGNLYSFVHNPGVVNSMFLGLLNLAHSNIILAVLTGISQFIQSKMMFVAQPATTGGADFASTMNKQMVYLLPLMTFFFALSLPAGLALYWTASTTFGIIQQYFVLRNKK